MAATASGPCVLCGKTEPGVRWIMGLVGRICEPCVRTSITMLRLVDSGRPGSVLLGPAASRRCCALCGEPAGRDDVLVGGAAGAVCPDCVDLCDTLPPEGRRTTGLSSS